MQSTVSQILCHTKYWTKYGLQNVRPNPIHNYKDTYVSKQGNSGWCS
jgi:hypothetical protein